MPKTYTFKPEWFMGKNIIEEVSKLCIGRTLNFPCGLARLGDVNADIFPDVKPDIIADLFDPLATFKKFSFDTVFCDPPYVYFCDNRIGIRWIYNISLLAKKRVIFKTPKFNIKLKRAVWKKHYYIIEDNRYSFCFLQVFDRINHVL